MIFTSSPPPAAPDFSALTDVALMMRLKRNQHQIAISVRDEEWTAVRNLTEDQNGVVAEIARRTKEQP